VRRKANSSHGSPRRHSAPFKFHDSLSSRPLSTLSRRAVHTITSSLPCSTPDRRIPLDKEIPPGRRIPRHRRPITLPSLVAPDQLQPHNTCASPTHAHTAPPINSSGLNPPSSTGKEQPDRNLALSIATPNASSDMCTLSPDTLNRTRDLSVTFSYLAAAGHGASEVSPVAPHCALGCPSSSFAPSPARQVSDILRGMESPAMLDSVSPRVSGINDGRGDSNPFTELCHNSGDSDVGHSVPLNLIVPGERGSSLVGHAQMARDGKDSACRGGKWRKLQALRRRCTSGVRNLFRLRRSRDSSPCLAAYDPYATM
jgi:hypothetical protein